MKTSFNIEIKSINETYGEEAAYVQLTGIHQITSRWILDYKKTRVLISVAEGPKNELIEAQYFQELYRAHGIHAENAQYLHYVVMLPKQLSAVTSGCLIEYLKARILNQTIAQHMLGCPKKYESDILGHFAQKIIRELMQQDSKRYHSFFRAPKDKEPHLRACPFSMRE